MKKLLLNIIGFVLLTSNLTAEEYKVSNAAEFKKINKLVKPGDTIVLLNGEWNDSQILFDALGTNEKPITLKAETPGKVVFTGSSSLKIAGDYLIVDGLIFKSGSIKSGSVIEFRNGSKREGNYSRLTNTSIEDYNPIDKTIDYKWVSLYGTNNRVDHCYFRNKTHQGCLLVVWLSDKPNYHLIDSNYFAYRPVLGNNGAEIIRVGTSDWSNYPSHTLVENNYFEQCNGEREIISNKSLYNIYRYNTFVESQGALTLRHGNFCEVYGNYFFGNNVKKTGGVRIISEGHKVYNNYFADLEGDGAYAALSIMNGVPNSPLNRYFQVKDVVVAFNTFVNNRHNFVIGEGKSDELSLPPINSVIANNIVYSTKGTLNRELEKPIGFNWYGNIYYGSDLGMEIPVGFNKLDPQLHKTDHLFRPDYKMAHQLKTDRSFEFIVDDIDGQKRQGIQTIGCDQFSIEKINRFPMNSKNTGPNWMK